MYPTLCDRGYERVCYARYAVVLHMFFPFGGTGSSILVNRSFAPAISADTAFLSASVCRE